MDRIKFVNRAMELFGKYKYAALVLLLGIFLMLLPKSTDALQEMEVPVKNDPQTCISEELEEILSKIEGVGKVAVLVTEASGRETVYQTDEDRDSDSLQVETVIVSGTDRGEYGLVRQENPPAYLGALIVCEGADKPSVRLAVVEAVSGVTGIPSDRVTVLKMN